MTGGPPRVVRRSMSSVREPYATSTEEPTENIKQKKVRFYGRNEMVAFEREEKCCMVFAIVETLVSLVGVVALLSYLIDLLWWIIRCFDYAMRHPTVFLHPGEGIEWERLVEHVRQEREDDLLWRDIAWPSGAVMGLFTLLWGFGALACSKLELQWYLLCHRRVLARYWRRKCTQRRQLR